MLKTMNKKLEDESWNQELPENEEEGNDDASTRSIASKFFTSQLRFYSAMLISYKVVEAARLARVFAHDPPTDVALIEEFEKHGIMRDDWAGWIEEHKQPHSVIIALQMTGGDALDGEIGKMGKGDQAEESLLFAVAS